MSEAEVLALLHKRQGKQSSLKYAAEIGVSRQYLADVYHHRRLPGPVILAFLGLEKGYWRKPEPEKEKEKPRSVSKMLELAAVVPGAPA